MTVAAAPDSLRGLHAALDKNDMLGLVAGFPSQMREAWELGGRFASSLEKVPFRRVVVCGMGGSAIGGDLASAYLSPRLRAPLSVSRAYEVPAGGTEDSFFVFSSYSGNTGETLSAYESVRGTRAPRVAITSGGRLAELCEADGVPVCRIPGGMPPRSAIAYSFFPLVRALEAVGAAVPGPGEFEEAQGALEGRCREYAPESDENPAAAVAKSLHRRLPFVYSCGGLLDGVARRWCTQINENGKSLAHWAVFTELNHNEIVGWSALADLRAKIAVVALEDPEDHPLSKRQAEIALEVIAPRCGEVVRIPPFAGGRMARALSAMILGDFVSVYLAYLNGEDPTPVANIDYLKQRLASS